MIFFEKAYEIVLGNTKVKGNEKINLIDSPGRILAQDVIADMDMPPFNKSAVDGYACRSKDIEAELEVIEVIPAGKLPVKHISEGKCSKIMTGAVIPSGADCVLMVENTRISGENKIRYIYKDSPPNICYTGEDIKKDTVVLPKGTLIKPQHVAVLASMGCVFPLVSVKPVIGIITTGEEIVEPDIQPDASQIRNSNAYQLISQTMRAGAIPIYEGIVPDKEEHILKALSKALTSYDIIILTGGVSMGDFDIVPAMLNRAGVNILFQTIAIQPGKPTLFGTYMDKLVFGLPGNPVSSFLQFELLVRPAICKMTGMNTLPSDMQLPVTDAYNRRRSERLSLVPVKVNSAMEVTPIVYHGSAHINSLNDANGVMFVPIGVSSIEKGALVNVRQI